MVRALGASTFAANELIDPRRQSSPPITISVAAISVGIAALFQFLLQYLLEGPPFYYR